MGDLVRRSATITERLRAEFDPGQVDLIRHTVAKDCDDGELAMFLEVCARYELDPLSKQIWAAKMSGKLQIIVSRDGLLTLANRSPDFRGCESDAVRWNDYFRKFRDPVLGTQVEHEYRDEEGNPTAHEDKRGAIIGAWALVHREAHKPMYFYATWAEYGTKAGGDRQSPWKTHPSAMIIKVAQAVTLRQAFSISGVVGEQEVARAQVLSTPGDGGPAEIEWGDDPALAEQLKAGFDVLGWTRSKMRLALRGKTDDERRGVLAQLHAEADRAAEGPIADAEVVPEPEAA